MGGCERNSLGSQGSTLSLAMDPLRCLLESQVEKYGFRCAAEHASFNSSPLDGHLGGFQFPLAQTALPSARSVGLWMCSRGMASRQWKHWVKGYEWVFF